MFKTGLDRLRELNEEKNRLPDPILYGIPFLDDTTGGIYPDSLIIVTAKTGFGKTELLSNVVQNAATAGKRVHMFALEAHRGELEARIKFRSLATAFYMCTRPDERTTLPNYQDWRQGRQDGLLAKYEPEVDREIEPFFRNFQTFYTEESFTIETFETQMHKLNGKTDLVILDHLHYMDLDGHNENVEFKRMVKQIKNIVSFWRKPVVCAAQLRKIDKGTAGLLPELDDIHGSSDIVKIATHVIGIAPAYDQQESFSKNMFPTYFKMLKNRMDGSRTHFVGLCGYDISKNKYSRVYQVGKLSRDGSELVKLKQEDYPQWARTAKIKAAESQTNFTLNGDARGDD